MQKYKKLHRSNKNNKNTKVILPDLTEFALLNLTTGYFYHSLVKPDKLISKTATEKTGINSLMVEKKMSQQEASLLIQNIIDNNSDSSEIIIIAHNGIKFDFVILQDLFNRFKISFQKIFSCYLVDSKDIFLEDQFTEYIPKGKKNRLYSIENVFPNLFQNDINESLIAHRALNDCIALAKIINRLYENINCNYYEELEKLDYHSKIWKNAINFIQFCAKPQYFSKDIKSDNFNEISIKISKEELLQQIQTISIDEDEDIQYKIERKFDSRPM